MTKSFESELGVGPQGTVGHQSPPPEVHYSLTDRRPQPPDPADVAARAAVISAWDRVRAWGASDKEAAQTFAGRLLALCHSSPNVASEVRGLLRDAGLVP
jgi:hypothetical protein